MKCNIEIKQREEDKTDYLQMITNKVKIVRQKIGQEQTEYRIGSIMLDIAEELGGNLEEKEDLHFIFDFTKIRIDY